MVNKNMVLSNLQIIKVWAQNGRKEEPGINPIRCEKVEQWVDETIKLLKAQGPAEPYIDFDGRDVWRCGNCGAAIFHPEHTQADEDERNYNKFCRHCGMAVKWDEPPKGEKTE